MKRLGIPVSLLLVGLLGYVLLVGPFSTYMQRKPIEEKLGFVPSIKVIKALSADQQELAGASLVMKVLMYFGGMLNKAQTGQILTDPIDLPGMSRLLHGAVKLDPYNMDAYYFAQGFLTWDAKQFKVANDLLDYGMRYRAWDWYLPFFAAFNHAYFLKDYRKAAEYYEKAAKLSNSNLHIQLAGRYLQESGQTDLAIVYLSTMVRSEKNQVLRRDYQIRLQAFQEVRRIELARDRFYLERGTIPRTVSELTAAGLLVPLPSDPYGGQFYLGADGKVATTSKFAFPAQQKK